MFFSDVRLGLASVWHPIYIWISLVKKLHHTYYSFFQTLFSALEETIFIEEVTSVTGKRGLDLQFPDTLNINIKRGNKNYFLNLKRNAQLNENAPIYEPDERGKLVKKRNSKPLVLIFVCLHGVDWLNEHCEVYYRKQLSFKLQLNIVVV